MRSWVNLFQIRSSHFAGIQKKWLILFCLLSCFRNKKKIRYKSWESSLPSHARTHTHTRRESYFIEVSVLLSSTLRFCGSIKGPSANSCVHSCMFSRGVYSQLGTLCLGCLEELHYWFVNITYFFFKYIYRSSSVRLHLGTTKRNSQ